MAKRTDNKLNGPLYNAAGERKVQFTPYQPSSDLQFFIERYWTLAWDLRGQPSYSAEHLPDPSVHLVIEDSESRVMLATRRFVRLVEGAGRAFCIKFRPGAFYPFVLSPISAMTDRTIRLPDLFGQAGCDLEAAIRAAVDDEERVRTAEDFLRSRNPEPDVSVALIHQIIETIVADGLVTRSAELQHRFILTQRTMQRLFRRYVGVSPSWVIRRYRIHDAVDQMERGKIVDWPALAADLGYFDQAHFIKEFKRMVGISPGKYIEQVSLLSNR